MRLYTLSQFRDKLAEAGISRSRLTIVDWQNRGILPEPKYWVEGIRGPWRLYSEKQIEKIIRSLTEGV